MACLSMNIKVALMIFLLFPSAAALGEGAISLPMQATGESASNLPISQVALVIGNSAYTNSPLKNPVNDAEDISIKLRKLGFYVIERNNLF